jgi:hypothetical protein
MLVVALLATQAQASKVVVNEIYRDTSLGSTGTEWVEVVLLEELLAAELETFAFGDSTSSTAAKFSGYRLQGASDFAASFPAGTILVIAGGAGPAEDLAYDPAGGDWSLLLRTTNAHVVGNGSTGDFAGTDVAYADTNGANGDATLSADGFAANWDSTPGAFGAIASVDGDGDGVCDDSDLCDGDDALDADLDGVPDACDVCDGDDGLDADLDGVPDACDDCYGR